jgi:hypothetical protein
MAQEGKERSAFSIASIPVTGLTQPPVQYVPRAVSLRLKREECDAEHSSASNANFTFTYVFMFYLGAGNGGGAI